MTMYWLQMEDSTRRHRLGTRERLLRKHVSSDSQPVECSGDLPCAREAIWMIFAFITRVQRRLSGMRDVVTCEGTETIDIYIPQKSIIHLISFKMSRRITVVLAWIGPIFMPYITSCNRHSALAHRKKEKRRQTFRLHHSPSKNRFLLNNAGKQWSQCLATRVTVPQVMDTSTHPCWSASYHHTISYPRKLDVDIENKISM